MVNFNVSYLENRASIFPHLSTFAPFADMSAARYILDYHIHFLTNYYGVRY